MLWGFFLTIVLLITSQKSVSAENKIWMIWVVWQYWLTRARGLEWGDCADSASAFLDSLRVFGSEFSQSQIKISSMHFLKKTLVGTVILIRLVYVVILQLSMSLLKIQAGKKWVLCSSSMWTQWLLSSVHLAEGNQTGRRHGGNWTTYLCKTHYIMWDITHTHSLSHAAQR